MHFRLNVDWNDHTRKAPGNSPWPRRAWKPWANGLDATLSQGLQRNLELNRILQSRSNLCHSAAIDYRLIIYILQDSPRIPLFFHRLYGSFFWTADEIGTVKHICRFFSPTSEESIPQSDPNFIADVITSRDHGLSSALTIPESPSNDIFFLHFLW